MKLREARGLKDLSEAELNAKLVQAREELFRLRFRHASTRLKNPLQIRGLRRDIARMLTLAGRRP